MNAIVLNTLTGAVTEYDRFDFQSITPTHAGSGQGLYLLGGDTDAGQPIVSRVVTGRTLWGSSLKKRVDMIYFSLRGEGWGEMSVIGAQPYAYRFPVLPSGQSRSRPGQGIRENYLAFGYSNAEGDDFQLDRIEVLVAQSPNRRI